MGEPTIAKKEAIANRSRSYVMMLLVFSLSGVIGLSVWNFLQMRGAMLQTHERWAQKVSDSIIGDRLAEGRWLASLRGMTPRDLRKELFTHSELAGAFRSEEHTSELQS